MGAGARCALYYSSWSVNVVDKRTAFLIESLDKDSGRGVRNVSTLRLILILQFTLNVAQSQKSMIELYEGVAFPHRNITG